ncbi:MAG: ATP-dependent RNA helicase [Cyanobacteria bacterium SW_11_48_12]|nr:MAG: ATP-dependent RNA helicase [Cyanobacteria bacterium SW_11_48_12]
MTTSFQSLGLSEARIERLQTLGFEKPTDVQAQAIPMLLQGRDVVGQSQTGTGKTAAFSLPILEQIDAEVPAVQALILTPTRELAQQIAQAVIEFCDDRSMRVLTVCGGQSMERQIRSLQRGVQIVVGTPGRVLDLLDRQKLQLESVSWVVLDEADEMLSMGFIEDVKKILTSAPAERKTACFSATMPRAIQALVKQFMRSPTNIQVAQPKSAPTEIEQRVYKVPRGWSKLNALQPILEFEDPEAALIFVRTKRSAAEVTQKLQAAGHSVDEYHGDLKQSQRERLVQRFRNLSHVINYDLPDNPESYIHRIGRTGRAGKTGTAISLSQYADRRMIREIERRSRQTLDVRPIPDRAQVEAQRLEKLQAQVQEALAGERMASFLPIVRELGIEYDPQAIAAAALQMFYDQTRPNWVETDAPKPERPKPKPRTNRKPNQSVTPK